MLSNKYRILVKKTVLRAKTALFSGNKKPNNDKVSGTGNSTLGNAGRLPSQNGKNITPTQKSHANSPVSFEVSKIFNGFGIVSRCKASKEAMELWVPVTRNTAMTTKNQLLAVDCDRKQKHKLHIPRTFLQQWISERVQICENRIDITGEIDRGRTECPEPADHAIPIGEPEIYNQSQNPDIVHPENDQCPQQVPFDHEYPIALDDANLERVNQMAEAQSPLAGQQQPEVTHAVQTPNRENEIHDPSSLEKRHLYQLSGGQRHCARESRLRQAQYHTFELRIAAHADWSFYTHTQSPQQSGRGVFATNRLPPFPSQLPLARAEQKRAFSNHFGYQGREFARRCFSCAQLILGPLISCNDCARLICMECVPQHNSCRRYF